VKAAEVWDLLSGLLAVQPAPEGSGAGVESMTLVGDHRLVVTFSDHTRAVLTVGVYPVQDPPPAN
jgi:hypothetical protein